MGTWGPAICGHANDEVNEALVECLKKGTSFGAPSANENVLAKMVIDAVPSVEMVRFTNSGTEACMGVLRLMRAYTKREKVIKFDGCYHGHADSFLVATGSGVATLGLLNKRNNVSRDLELQPGDQQRVGDVIVRLQACERTAPWEMPSETGAFVQLLVKERGTEDQFRKVFSGWLFKNSPSLNVVEHPIYDVWVKECAMSFPGEEDVEADA